MNSLFNNKRLLTSFIKHITFFLRAFILIAIIYSISMLSMQIIASFIGEGNSDGHYTIMNFLLPGIITIGFMIAGAIEMHIKRESIKKIKIILLIYCIAELLAIKWQISTLYWATHKRSFFEILPFWTGIIVMTYIFIKLIANYNSVKRKLNRHE